MAQTKITGDMIADDAVTTALIADDAVTADQLANSINSAITANTAKVTNAITTHTGDVTGAAALTIAVDAVDIPMLSATGSPSNTTFLRGDNAWAEVPAGVDIQSSAPSVASEGSLYYNTTTDKLYLSNGTAWLPLDTNAAPVPTGGTVTIATQLGLSTFSYNLGLNFTDEDIDANLIYTLESGTLPAGAVLPTSGNTALTGTATSQATATYNFVIRATDTNAAFATQAYTQVITQPFSATGGTITNAGGYRYHTFTSSGTFAVVGDVNKLADIAIIAGGGSGGGSTAGGAGAGGFIESNGYSTSAQNYTITIGAGGAIGGTTGLPGLVGANTVAFGQTAIGGGGGASVSNGGGSIYAAVSGGSGGGGCSWGSLNTGGAAGTSGQGNAGGDGLGNATGGLGGGGKMAAGGTHGGGDGKNWKSLGTYYAGGGGGAPNYTAGGAGGGGAGDTSGGNGGSGTANTGGGGGGAYYYASGAGGTGGSGIVIIRYAV